FLANPSDLWSRVIQKIYGPCGGIKEVSSRRLGMRNCFIANMVPLKDWSYVFHRHPRGGVEASQFVALQSAIGNMVLSIQSDSWQWSPDISAGFSVASVRALVDTNTLDVGSVATRWNRSIPIKVNVFLWRLSLNKLPSRFNLDRRGVDVGSILCPNCSSDVETVNHIFFNCEMAKDLWALMAKWWELDIPICANISDWYSWLNSIHVSNRVRLIIEGMGGTLLWSIWSFRNHMIFSSPPPKKALL
ncbi:RNA-directed DNA polymerase, eukaryota, reverse transcriptase zinc-binding domain protein, partial [Tanacetum coccineum]